VAPPWRRLGATGCDCASLVTPYRLLAVGLLALAEEAANATQGPADKKLHALAPGVRSNRRGCQAAATEPTVEIVHHAAPVQVRRPKRDAERDRHLGPVPYVVRRGHRKVQPEARLQLVLPGLRLVLLLEDHIAMGAVVKALQLLVRQNRAIARIEQVDDLRAANLQEEIVLWIHVIRRHRARRRDEDERLRLAHARVQGLRVDAHLVEATVQEGAIIFVVLDVLE